MVLEGGRVGLMMEMGLWWELVKEYYSNGV